MSRPVPPAKRPVRYFAYEVFEQSFEVGLCLVEFADVVLTKDGVPVAVLVSPDGDWAAAARDRA